MGQAFENVPLNFINVLELVHNESTKGMNQGLRSGGGEPGGQSVREFVHKGLVTKEGRGVLSQELVREGVKRSCVHCGGAEKSLDTVDHFIGGGATEGDEENAARIHTIGLYDVGNAGGDGRCFSRARGSQNALVFIKGGGHHLVLLFIQRDGAMGEGEGV